MNLAATLFCAVATLLSVQAITVSVDRADVRPVSPPDQGHFVNGWRPLTATYDVAEENVSPATTLDRSLAPLHPVLGKLQEHMAVSERFNKPQRRVKPQQIDYNPPSILGSFAVFSHALPKQRGENPGATELKPLSTEREYSFLIPPPRDSLRFELEPMKKAPLRDNEPYVRSSQFIPQAIKPDPRSPSYYIKPATFNTGLQPFAQSRPFVNNYNIQQSLIPPRNPAKQFDGLKSSNDKPYYQPPNVDGPVGFNKDNNKVNPEPGFDRFQQQQQQQQQQINGNFYNQINHPSHYKQATYERDPSFLVHESHEISYVTPSSTFKFRPSTYHFENAPQESFPSSTVPPRVESNKYTQQQAPSSARPEGFKQFQSSPKDTGKHHQDPHHGSANPFYISDFQKTRYTPDINEVLPKANQPAKFNQVSTTQAPFVPEQTPKVVYVRPELQQQYQSSIIPLNINQRPPEIDYETPESISLKHFNEQQFLLQQQLIQQDRQRLREQEKRRQQELQRQQQEELTKRQQEIKLLEQKQKEKQQYEQQQTIVPDIVREISQRPHYSQSYPIEEQKKIPKEQYKYVHYQQQHEVPQASSESPFQSNKDDEFKPVTVQKFEEVVTPAVAPSTTTQEDFQPVIRPYRPQKPFRDQIRRRKPTTVAYEPPPTEPPVPQTPETFEELTDIPIQTTSAPEITTIPVTERVFRTRRPGGPPLRRRRPTTTTTTTPGPIVSSQEYEEELIKYNTPENQEFEKKKRVRPVANNHQEGSSERRPLRKRPGQRVKVYNKEHADFDTVPERVRTTERPFKDISPTENYPEPFLKELYSAEYIPTSEKTFAVDSAQETSTESIPVEYYSAETTQTTLASNLEYYESSNDDHQEQYTQTAEENASLDHLFTKTDANYVETTTAPPPPPPIHSTTTTTTTTTTTEASTTAKPVISSPKVTHRMRVRYGNATRPRFSIKDYKSRMDYKNRLSQSSSTEPSTVTAGPKRGYKNHQQAPADPNFKEPTRYKYTSRSSYRTTSTTPTSQQVDETSSNTVTTEKSTRYTPKKRINTSHFYRSRVSGTTAASANKQEQEHSSTATHSTARPENVFSSSIRKRPTLKSRLHSSSNKVLTESPEMQSAAETGFFVTTTVASSSVGFTESVNEIPEQSEAIDETVAAVPKKAAVESQDEKSSSADLSDVTMDESDDKDKIPTVTESQSVSESNVQTVDVQETFSVTQDNRELQLEDISEQATSASTPDSTTPFDIRHEEELFAKASQSVADLTSSASALYDKPGMFKAVSPVNENRAISAHLKIATDEPTLPIEAFFQEFARKN